MIKKHVPLKLSNGIPKTFIILWIGEVLAGSIEGTTGMCIYMFEVSLVFTYQSWDYHLHTLMAAYMVQLPPMVCMISTVSSKSRVFFNKKPILLI